MVLERLVVLLSELAARCLGNAHFRRHFHLWVALLILLGPGLTFHVSHSTVFANRRNFLYLYFLRSGWGWTCLLTGGFVLLVSYSSTRSPASCLRHLTRLLVASLLWKGALWSFAQVENATGSCFQPIRSEIPEATAAAHRHSNYPQGGGASASSSPLLLLRETENKASCLAEGYFLRSGWGWTCLLTGGFVLLVSYSSTRSPASCLRHLTRLLVASLLWKGALWSFAQVENATGSCFQPIRSEIPEATAAAHRHSNYPQGGGASASSSPLLLLRETENKASCLAEGFQWRGYDISEDTFLLTFAVLLVAEETAVFRPYLSRGHPAGVPLRLVFLLCSALLLLWNFLLLCVLVYFQRYTHKLLGGALATLCWRLLYHGWYKSGPCWYSPGRPGVGLFDRPDQRDN
ncbi:Fat storage-inducing transmembrane protein 1 [Acipenser ruthenus]|uniref:Fat storage-inducing transmembrane protein 1 homolog n=1 Tax=Acipenser ruthenus TaxID=7906 RepID=A0A444V4F0_ACIRT|nr:Fat storage-inducing transmembrane protein 1 [Acipenser ruthenus]